MLRTGLSGKTVLCLTACHNGLPELILHRNLGESYALQDIGQKAVSVLFRLFNMWECAGNALSPDTLHGSDHMTQEAQASAENRRVRTVTCTASISAATHCRLDAFLRQQTVLWNDALEERIDCYRKTGKTTAKKSARNLAVDRRHRRLKVVKPCLSTISRAGGPRALRFQNSLTPGNLVFPDMQRAMERQRRDKARDQGLCVRCGAVHLPHGQEKCSHGSKRFAEQKNMAVCRSEIGVIPNASRAENCVNAPRN